MKSFKLIFISIVFSVLEVHGGEVQEIMPVPPQNYTRKRITMKIVGGSPAREHQFPWQASVTSCSGQSCSTCGGSLISRRYILTAAHCTAGLSEFQIGLGTNKRNKPTVNLISKVKIEHPKYHARWLINDVSIIKLPRAVRLNKGVQIIPLARKNETFNNRYATASGYGKTSSLSSVSDQLNYVDMRIISNTECKKTYGLSVQDSTLCAVGKNRASQNVCQGDSGGPLVVKEGNSFVQVGVVSFVAKAGCEYGFPSGYARVSSFYPWIIRTASRLL
uniref:Trypsin n=1 Tax=Culicoides nubeculosus TaxID=144565 RepID=B9URH8_CULNU|nr:trypsin [Culicoides nubeculosus]